MMFEKPLTFNELITDSVLCEIVDAYKLVDAYKQSNWKT